MRKSQFTLHDFMAQMGQVRTLGPVGKIMGMIPGMRELTRQLQMGDSGVEMQMGRMTAIYNAMTKEEREDPDILNGSRRSRIAHGAALPVREVIQFFSQYRMWRDMMAAVSRRLW